MAKLKTVAAELLVAWEAETVSARRMTALAEKHPDSRTRARLMVLAAFCRAHASRLLARWNKMGVKVAPVVSQEDPEYRSLSAALRAESEFAAKMALRYSDYAERARAYSDLSSAWVFELNRSEEQDRSRELLALSRPTPPRDDVKPEAVPSPR
ncbi:hypothetical protein [Myxococcus phage Mx1]|nr:hypothetical protein [Myxococcus phage Mx1]